MARGFRFGGAGGAAPGIKPFYIYNLGEWGVGFENPGTAHDTPGDTTVACSLGTNKISVGPSNNNYNMALLCTSLIDMSKYTTLHVQCKSIANVSTYGGATIYASSDRTDLYNSKYISASISDTNIHELAFDISTIDSAYVAFTSNGARCAEVYQVWLTGPDDGKKDHEVKALIPIMTSNTAPSGVVNQSSYYNGDAAYIGYKAFDGNSSTQWVTAANNLSLNWLSYAFTTPVVVKSAMFYGLRYERSAEGTCKLQGSNDGSTWVDISDEIDISTRFDGVINFPNNKTAYTNYRLYQNQGAGGIEIFELQLYGYKLYPEPAYSSEGLTVQLDRCTIDSGGFRLNENVVEVDITFTAKTALSYRYGVVLGFPTSIASGDVSLTHNDFCINNSSGTMSLLLNVNKTIPADTTIRFIGSYQWR